MRLIAVLLVTMLAAPLASGQTLSGPYVGGYLGGGSADAHWDILPSGSRQDHSLSGGVIGVQGGYNWIAGNWLLGVQGDLGVGSIKGSSRCPNPAFECETELGALITVRGRAGPVFGNVAPYLTAGFASAGVATRVRGAGSEDEDIQGHGGWTAGLGVTGLIGRNITWQVEYLRVDLGSEEHILQGLINEVDLTVDILRIGVHYKW
jgi:outer membrane immunogenic protein